MKNKKTKNRSKRRKIVTTLVILIAITGGCILVRNQELIMTFVKPKPKSKPNLNFSQKLLDKWYIAYIILKEVSVFLIAGPISTSIYKHLLK